jgi:hypothetical protein
MISTKTTKDPGMMHVQQHNRQDVDAATKIYDDLLQIKI